MKAEEIRRMEDVAVEAELETNKRSLLNLRCQLAMGEEVHPDQVLKTKKTIARMKTVMREKAIASEKASATQGGEA